MHASKREFPTFEQASNAANLIFRRTHEQMVPYKCEFCAGFHIGHQREEYR